MNAAKSVKKAEQMERAKIPYPDAIYRVFRGNDAECWTRYDHGEIKIISQQVFHFTGLLCGPSSFHLNQERSLDRVLAEGAGLIINRKVMDLCNGNYNPTGTFPTRDPRFIYTDKDLGSADGNTYKLFQDYDGGARGWALFTVKRPFKSRSKMSIIFEDHNDNVRDWMLSPEFLTKMGLNLNFKHLWRANHDFYKKPYQPTEEDFKKDFHIDEKGRRKKA